MYMQFEIDTEGQLRKNGYKKDVRVGPVNRIQEHSSFMSVAQEVSGECQRKSRTLRGHLSQCFTFLREDIPGGERAIDSVLSQGPFQQGKGDPRPAPANSYGSIGWRPLERFSVRR